MASLFVIRGRDQGKRFELRDRVMGIGRDNSNAVQLYDTEVSRRHAEIRKSGEAFSLVDLNSSNGSFVNGDRAARAELSSGDRVQLGRTLMIFTANEAPVSENLEDLVEFVSKDSFNDGSRIVRSVTQEESSQVFGDPREAKPGSPWLARARSNLQVMYRTALAVSHTLDIDQLLERILELIFEWVEADRGCIMLNDAQTDELVPKAKRTRKGVREDKITISKRILEYVQSRNEGVLTSDAQDDQRWDPEGSILRLGVREAICVPMQGRYGTVGVVYIDTYTPPGGTIVGSQSKKFTEEHLKLMVAIGHQAALAVEDTSYYSAMVQAERLAAVGHAIATLSHHIKNILQGIRGGSYLIEEGLRSQDFEVCHKGWNIVEKNQDKISNLVMDMLTFGKEREPELVTADINETIADVIELMQVRAQQHEVSLQWRRSESVPPSKFDPDALHRAILNLVTNAVDACDDADDRRVKVSADLKPASEESPAMIHVVVEDTGRGIEHEDLVRIFNVFESRKGSRGTGLGLPVSLKILKEHGGDIAVESTPGKGSKFTVMLPYVESAPEDAESEKRWDDTRS